MWFDKCRCITDQRMIFLFFWAKKVDLHILVNCNKNLIFRQLVMLLLFPAYLIIRAIMSPEPFKKKSKHKFKYSNYWYRLLSSCFFLNFLFVDLSRKKVLLCSIKRSKCPYRANFDKQITTTPFQIFQSWKEKLVLHESRV